MDPKTATRLRGDSFVLLLISGLLLYLGVKCCGAIGHLFWLPLGVSLVGTVLVLSRYRHFE
ncbi:MAG: hypothetical protein ABIC95_06120 [archaeon]